MDMRVVGYCATTPRVDQQSHEDILKHAIYNGKSYRTCCPSSCCRCCTDGTLLSYFCYLFLPWIALAAGCMLIVFGILLVKPYMEVQSFEASNCTVIRSFYDGNPSCTCGKHCKASYPCLKILVSHSSPPGSLTQLYQDEFELRDNKCSYKPHCGTASGNTARVKDFEDKWGMPGQTYNCLVNPEDTSEVIQEIRFSNVEAISILLWLGLAFLVCVTILACLYHAYGCMGCKIAGLRCKQQCNQGKSMKHVPWGLYM